MSLQDLVSSTPSCHEVEPRSVKEACSTLSVAAASFYSPASAHGGSAPPLHTLTSPAFSALFMFLCGGDCSVVLELLSATQPQGPTVSVHRVPPPPDPRLHTPPLKCLGARVELSDPAFNSSCCLSRATVSAKSVHALSSFLRLLPCQSTGCSLCLWTFCPARWIHQHRFLDPIYVH